MSEKFYANFMFGVDAQLNPKTDIRFTYISKHSPQIKAGGPTSLKETLRHGNEGFA